jgi:hypothetical protein
MGTQVTQIHLEGVIMTALEIFAADYRQAIKLGNAPDYGEPVDVRVDVSGYGTSIDVMFADGRTLSPYFNQSDSEGDCYGDYGGMCGAPDECEETGYCGSDRFAALEDADEWLNMMSGAANWEQWEWVA